MLICHVIDTPASFCVDAICSPYDVKMLYSYKPINFKQMTGNSAVNDIPIYIIKHDTS